LNQLHTELKLILKKKYKHPIANLGVLEEFEQAFIRLNLNQIKKKKKKAKEYNLPHEVFLSLSLRRTSAISEPNSEKQAQKPIQKKKNKIK
jgi:hypothetical protein